MGNCDEVARGDSPFVFEASRGDYYDIPPTWALGVGGFWAKFDVFQKNIFDLSIQIKYNRHYERAKQRKDVAG